MELTFQQNPFARFVSQFAIFVTPHIYLIYIFFSEGDILINSGWGVKLEKGKKKQPTVRGVELNLFVGTRPVPPTRNALTDTQKAPDDVNHPILKYYKPDFTFVIISSRP